MLLLELHNNDLRIHGCALKAHQRSQLRAWGFSARVEGEFHLPSERVAGTLPKLISYLKKQSIHYQTESGVDEILTDHAERQFFFDHVKLASERFKQDTSLPPEMREFIQFCSTSIARKLKSHQEKAAYHLYLSQNGANFSVPGSGKTQVVLTVFEKLKQEGKVNLLYVVGPPSCFSPWIQEFAATFDRQPDARILAGGDVNSRKEEYYKGVEQLADVYLTTFQSLMNDEHEVERFFNRPNVRPFLVIDEAHYIKQLDGNWARAVLNVSRGAAHRCILTGTPMPKSFSDVYNLFDFLWPDIQVIDSTSRVRINSFERENRVEEAKEILHSKIGPLFYRVRKSDLGLKPPVFHPPIVIRMNPLERDIYAAITERIHSLSSDDDYADLEVIDSLKRARIIRLRQCVSYARLVVGAISGYDEKLIGEKSGLARKIARYDAVEKPAKLQRLVELLQEHISESRKVLVWTTFIGTIELIQASLRNLGINCRSIFGKTPTVRTSIEDEMTREEIREEFLDPQSGVNVLIANPAACAESISLHKGCYVAVYYDLSYNCAQYLQSLDRIHRVGGSENAPAHYYFLQYADSLDQDILSNVRRKAEKMSRIIDVDYGIYDADMFADDDEVDAYDRLFG
jgi:SNF2 family DNA or RNA helicase